MTALEAREILADATPKDTGDTARRWQVELADFAGGWTAAFVYNDSVVMSYLEYGTRPHKIIAKNGKALAFTPQAGSSLNGGTKLYRSAKTGKLVKSVKLAQTVLVQSVNHPGTRPTFTVRRNLGKIAKLLNQNLETEIQRLINGG